MKNFVLLTILMLSISEGISQTSKMKVPDSIIVWSVASELMWADFKGSSDDVLFGAASTSYKIDIIPDNVMVDEDDNIQGYEKMNVSARFYKNQSWTTTTKNSILIHERLHFDIAELFARKIRKRFEELKRGSKLSFLLTQRHIVCYGVPVEPINKNLMQKRIMVEW